MDPVTAFGVATGVIQVLEFGRQITKDCLEISKLGGSRENLSIERTTRHLAAASESLSIALHEASAGKKFVSEDDRQLQALAVECGNVAQDLLDLLGTLKPNEGGKPRAWQVLKKGLSSLWERDEIKRLERQLERLRGTMDTEILVRLTERFDSLSLQQNDAFHQLDQKSQTIISALASNQQSLATIVASEHAETRDTLTRHLEDMRGRYVSERDHEELLGSLYFDTIFTRQEDISETHRETFQWVFDGSTERPWHNFVTWLEQGSGIYWIKGKAGSGKSTLMKLICEDARTENALRIWAGDSDLLMPSFFFWSSGSADQKSLSGMLKSLLYQVIEAFPLLARSITSSRQKPSMRRNVAWSSKRLLATVQTILRRNVISLKLVLLLDGLDEMEEDHAPLIECLTELSREPNLKLCVSSRPLRPFELAFRDAATLQLHDLTFQDIKQFAADRLNAHVRMQHLQIADPPKAEELMMRVSNMAAGVFLWVSLAVRQLNTGLDNEDSLDELFQRLDLIPAEIEDLYSLMLDSLDKLYHDHAVKYFNLMLTCRGGSMHLLDFAFAEGDPVKAPLFGYSGNLSASPFVTNMESLKVKILTRCKGFLEVQEGGLVSRVYIENYGARYHGHMLGTKLRRFYDRHMTVRWLHRTVPDFLLFTERGKAFMNTTPKSTWQAYEGHITNHLCRIRLASTFLDIFFGSRDNRHVENIMFYAVKAETATGSANVTFMDHVDHQITRISTLFNASSNEHWSTRFPPAADFLGFTATRGLFLYVMEKMKAKTKDQMALNANYLLRCTNLRYWDFRDQELYCQTLTELLQHGAQPNVITEQTWNDPLTTPWTLFLRYIRRINNRKRLPRRTWIATTTAFVNAGAELKQAVPSFGAKDGYRVEQYTLSFEMSPLSILLEFLLLEPGDTELERLIRERDGKESVRITSITRSGREMVPKSYSVETERQSDTLSAAWQDRKRAMSDSRLRKSRIQSGNEKFVRTVEDVLKQLTPSSDSDVDDEITAVEEVQHETS